MAAGRHGGNRKRESRREDLYHERRFRVGDEEQRRGGGGYWERSGRGGRRETNEKETLNGTCRSSSSTSDSSGDSGCRHRRSRFLDGSAIREPGEITIGSGSDDPDVPQSKARGGGVLKLENVAFSPPNKKRKFSPIVWDRDDDKQSNAVPSRSKKNHPVYVYLPLRPPSQGIVPTNSIEIARHVELPSPSESEVIKASPPENLRNDDQETGQLEEEEDSYAVAPSILSSRWAGRNAAVDDDDEDLGEHFVARRRKNTPMDLVASGSHKKVPTPELGVLIVRQGSEGSGSRASHLGKVGDIHPECEVDWEDHMDVEEDDGNEDTADHQSGCEMEPEHPPRRSTNMLQGCRSIDVFERLNKIDEGTYGIVYRAKDRKTGEIVALKKVKMEKEREGFPLTSLREINILLSFHHPSIVDVKEVVVDTNNLDSIFMVMEYMEHDLKGLTEMMNQPFCQSEVKCLMLQLLEGVKYLHDNWVLHRDLKTSNILLNNRGELKICDFGMARWYGSPLKPYTQLVVTLSYRAPELLLGARQYSTAVDMWSLGCIMAELLAKEPLFHGKTEVDQLDKIFRTLGTPNEKIWPGFVKLPGAKVNFVKQPYNRLREKFPPTFFSGRPTLSEAGVDLLNKLLTYDPEKRITAAEALNHEWFREVPLPKSKDFMPTFPAQHTQERRLRRKMRSPDPLEELRRNESQQRETGAGSLLG